MSDSSADSTEVVLSEDRGDIEDIRSQFAGTDLSRHLALFYRDRAEQLAVATAFVARGVQRNERVLYIVDDNDPETLWDSFTDASIDVECARESGQLTVRSADEVYVGDTFDPVETVSELETLAEEAATDGFDGFRIAGENTWSFDLDCEYERVMEFEARFDERHPDMPVTAMCQYSLDQFDDAAIGKALQTHEQVIYRRELCENPYYVPPERALGTGAPLSNATLLLEQTRDVDQFRRDVETREQRLSVVNRVLRHNLRNDVNVILGRLDWLLEQDEIPDEGPAREQIDTLVATAERLSRLSEKARHVNRTLESVERSPADLNEAVAEAIETVTDAHAGFTVDLDRAPAGTTVADGVVTVAVREVLQVAADHLPEESVAVSVRTDDAAGLATIEIVADDPFVTEAARTALDRGREESLQHAVGLELWVARWVVDRINGSLDLGTGPVDRVQITAPIVAT